MGEDGYGRCNTFGGKQDNLIMKIKGIVESIIFQNVENWYTVVELDSDGILETVVGVFPPIAEGEEVEGCVADVEVCVVVVEVCDTEVVESGVVEAASAATHRYTFPPMAT